MKIKAVYKVACSIKWPHTQKMPGDVEMDYVGAGSASEAVEKALAHTKKMSYTDEKTGKEIVVEKVDLESVEKFCNIDY